MAKDSGAVEGIALPEEEGSTRKSVQEYAGEYAQIKEDELPLSLGFSARLNMLWDLADVVPSQLEGRTVAILAINNEWRETEVRKWLQKDVLPPRIEFHNIVNAHWFLRHQNPATD